MSAGGLSAGRRQSGGEATRSPLGQKAVFLGCRLGTGWAGAESRLPYPLHAHPPSDRPGAAGGFQCPCSRVSGGSRLQWRGPAPHSLPLPAVGSEPSPPLAVMRNSFSPSSERKRRQGSVPLANRAISVHCPSLTRSVVDLQASTVTCVTSGFHGNREPPNPTWIEMFFKIKLFKHLI